MLEVRQANSFDIDYVYPLVLAYYKDDRQDVDLDEKEIFDALEEMLNNGTYTFLASIEGPKVTGVACTSTSLVMGRLLTQEVLWKIDPAYSKTKAGALLMARIEDDARERSSEAVALVALAGEHQKRVGNAYKSKGYAPLACTYIKELR